MKGSRAGTGRPMKEKSLVCSWEGCECPAKENSSSETFSKHVISHSFEEGEDTGECNWIGCPTNEDREGPRFSNRQRLARHLSLHAYVVWLHSQGLEFCNKLGSGSLVCKKPYVKAAMLLLDCEDPWKCRWDDCSAKFDNILTFFAHMRWHAHQVRNDPPPIPCLWAECDSGTECKTWSKLVEHLRKHSGEKTVSCPSCGLALASRSKLREHARRQAPTSAEHKCRHCFKCFPSERILRDHARRHINLYCCSVCHLTLSSPSAMANHYLFRHNTTRPFVCQQPNCNYACARKAEYDRHMETHMEEPSDIMCPLPTCDFRAKNKRALLYHEKHEHSGAEKRVYVCHVCEGRWTRGSVLTQHLKKQHGITLPDRYKRHTYLRGEDGLYRVQTERYELAAAPPPPLSAGSPGENDSELADYELESETSENRSWVYDEDNYAQVDEREEEDMDEEIDEDDLSESRTISPSRTGATQFSGAPDLESSSDQEHGFMSTSLSHESDNIIVRILELR